ncbi:hypothetical protein AB205_0208270 [Aquarana catesbeiana]|uniref:Uncharacterized protein n=1 Tax=Aquarana catesbeiana TaxID=8400 RepID=A0A2G9R5Z0_AQUCT|nr:hypothetical protein AB205_0208270 [Aquarana catesbeiana]
MSLLFRECDGPPGTLPGCLCQMVPPAFQTLFSRAIANTSPLPQASYTDKMLG